MDLTREDYTKRKGGPVRTEPCFTCFLGASDQLVGRQDAMLPADDDWRGPSTPNFDPPPDRHYSTNIEKTFRVTTPYFSARRLQ